MTTTCHPAQVMLLVCLGGVSGAAGAAWAPVGLRAVSPPTTIYAISCAREWVDTDGTHYTYRLPEQAYHTSAAAHARVDTLNSELPIADRWQRHDCEITPIPLEAT